MLKLTQINKVYKAAGAQPTSALCDVDLEFGAHGMVSILGPSGCGKTTLLNIIGGLDDYTSGDMVLDGISTKEYSEYDWNVFRSQSVGFVFQSYNLVAHLSVLQNVALALSLRGVGRLERLTRARDAIVSVGLGAHINKRPNQLSSGQMQRVAIARALVSNPKILLADEPTGALDYANGLQIMELLKEVSKTRLVVVVTHNRELADTYSDRIITLKDGQVKEDVSANTQELGSIGAPKALTNESYLTDNTVIMSGNRSNTKFLKVWTAFALSFRSLLTKKVRTILTAIAGSLGIIGIGLVLAITGATNAQIIITEANIIAGTPLTITDTTNQIVPGSGIAGAPIQGQFPDSNTMYTFDRRDLVPLLHTNYFCEDFMRHLGEIDPSLITNINFARGMALTAISRREDGVYRRIMGRNNIFQGVSRISGNFVEIPPNEDFVLRHHDLLYGQFPTQYNHIVLMIDRYNRIERNVLDALGFEFRSHTFEEILGRSLRIIRNNDLYMTRDTHTDEHPHFVMRTNNSMLYQMSDIEVRIVGIMRERRGMTQLLPAEGLGFTRELAEMMLEDAYNSHIATAQRLAYVNADIVFNQELDRYVPMVRDVINGGFFDPRPGHGVSLSARMFELGSTTAPRTIQIFATNFEALRTISEHISGFNYGREGEDVIFFQNPTVPSIEMVEATLNVITVVFFFMIAISLAVSVILTGIISYVSILERTKEIGILRAMGARKRDIFLIFCAEVVIIGLVSGVLGIVMAYILAQPINSLIYLLVAVETSASLPGYFAALLLLMSAALAFLAGFIPALIAAKKAPVAALRVEV